MAVATTLFRLEQVDAELEQREATLLEVRLQQQRNAELDAAEARLAALRAREAAAATEQRTLEGLLADLQAKITRDHARLYGGTIVDSREIGSLQRELEHYGAQRSEVEDHLLDAMQQLETLQEQVQTTSQQTTTRRAQWDAARPARDQQIRETIEAIQDLRGRREPLAAELDPRSAYLYQRLRANSGHAISVVTDGVCQWCRVVIPTKDVQHARSGALVTCTNCGRILYPGS